MNATLAAYYFMDPRAPNMTIQLIFYLVLVALRTRCLADSLLKRRWERTAN